MPPKTSAEMREALRLVAGGATVRDAARIAGVREESVYRKPEYKAWRDARHAEGILKFSISEGRRQIHGAGPGLAGAIFNDIEKRADAVIGSAKSKEKIVPQTD